MNDFVYEIDDGKVTITGYKGNSGDVVIPDEIDGLPVTRIGSYAFQYDSNLTSITLGNSITTIGEYAFRRCYGLTIITLGNSITTIGSWALTGCPAAIIIRKKEVSNE